MRPLPSYWPRRFASLLRVKAGIFTRRHRRRRVKFARNQHQILSEGIVMSESNAVVPQSETAAPALSQIQRVLYIFTAPSKTFTDILRSSNWLLPFVLSLIFSCGFAYVV